MPVIPATAIGNAPRARRRDRGLSSRSAARQAMRRSAPSVYPSVMRTPRHPFGIESARSKTPAIPGSRYREPKRSDRSSEPNAVPALQVTPSPFIRGSVTRVEDSRAIAYGEWVVTSRDTSERLASSSKWVPMCSCPAGGRNASGSSTASTNERRLCSAMYWSIDTSKAPRTPVPLSSNWVTARSPSWMPTDDRVSTTRGTSGTRFAGSRECPATWIDWWTLAIPGSSPAWAGPMCAGVWESMGVEAEPGQSTSRSSKPKCS